MKMKNLFLVSLLSLASLQIQSSDAQAEEVVAEAQVQEAAPIAEVNPIPAELQPYSGLIIRWVRAGQTPEERSQRAALLLKWNYANDAQIALLSSFIISVAQDNVEITN